MTAHTLFPPLEPFKTEQLQVSGLHALYLEQSGNPQGQPVLFLHGGPGGGTLPKHRRFFDPAHYRIILFDQRGCGRSLPSAELRDNTTWDLVQDIETIRQHLGLGQWLLFGGSWGSTLALAYAVTHPAQVQGLILRGIFLCRPQEIQWFYQYGASQLFPEVWESYLAPIAPAERHDLVGAYHRLLTGTNEAAKLDAARAWSKWEGATSTLLASEEMVQVFNDGRHALEFARIENHYCRNNAFFSSPNYLLENADKLRGIPGLIVQGRYDVVCPAASAWELSRAWPEARLQIVPDAGHSAWEPGILAALVAATEAFRESGGGRSLNT